METKDDASRAASAAMARYAAGDDAAFGAVYDALAPRLYDFLLGLTRNRAQAEDLLQQTFLQIHRARGSFIPGSDLRPWSFAIARRLFIDGARRRKLEEAHLREQWDAPPALVDPPDRELAARRLAGRMQETLAQLPESQRTAFTLIKQEGLSVAEAAARLGATAIAVKLRTHRAMEALRAVAGDDGDPQAASDAGPMRQSRSRGAR